MQGLRHRVKLLVTSSTRAGAWHPQARHSCFYVRQWGPWNLLYEESSLYNSLINKHFGTMSCHALRVFFAAASGTGRMLTFAQLCENSVTS